MDFRAIFLLLSVSFTTLSFYQGTHSVCHFSVKEESQVLATAEDSKCACDWVKSHSTGFVPKIFFYGPMVDFVLDQVSITPRTSFFKDILSIAPKTSPPQA